MIEEFASNASLWLGRSMDAAAFALALAFFMAAFRAWRGPHLTDRLLALMLAWSLAIAAIALFALRVGDWLYLDLALALAVIGSAIPLAALLVARVAGEPLRPRKTSQQVEEVPIDARTD